MFSFILDWIKRIWSGSLPLPRMALLYGVIGSLIAGVLVKYAYLSMFISEDVGLLLFIIPILAIGYEALVCVGIWRSAGHYQGRKAWGMLARLAVVLLLLALVFKVGSFFMRAHDAIDSSLTLQTAGKTLKRDPRYPLTGLWSTDCSANFGLLIEPSQEEGKYSVSFCGPGGCFKPGTYRPNTAIVDDPHYRVINSNTIQVQTKLGFETHERCE